MSTITSLDELLALYDQPLDTSVVKEIAFISPLHQQYIDASPFVLVASSGPDGLDCSPRGDPAGFVTVADPTTLHLPDRRGNNRLDTLRNLVVDPRIGLLFLVPGVGVTLRVNGTATLSTEPELRQRYAIDGKAPTTVIIVHVASVYTQCPKAIIRSHLWDPARHRDPASLPSVGDILSAITDGTFDGQAYDASYPERIKATIY